MYAAVFRSSFVPYATTVLASPPCTVTSVEITGVESGASAARMDRT